MSKVWFILGGLVLVIFKQNLIKAADASTSSIQNLINWASKYSCLIHFMSVNQEISESFSYDEYQNTLSPSVNQINVNLTNWTTLESSESMKTYFYQTKFSICTHSSVILRISEGISLLNLKHELALVLRHLQSPFHLKENPRHFSIVVPSNLLEPSVNEIFLVFMSSLQLIHTSSKYYVTCLDKFYIICQSCDPKQILKQTFLTSFQSLTKDWFSVHKNLSGIPIIIKRKELYGFEQTNHSNCDTIGLGFYGDKRLCVLKWMAEFLNFDIRLSLKSKWILTNAEEAFINHLKIKTNPLTDLVLNEVDNFQVGMIYNNLKTVPALKNTRVEWIPHVWIVYPVSFALVLDKTILSHQALYKPYDEKTWILTLISWIVVSLVLVLCIWINQVFSYQSNGEPLLSSFKKLDIGKMVLITLGSIMEQNPSDKTIKNSIISFRILFGTWLITSLILSNGYTGIVISFLCSSITPTDLPISIKELLNSPKMYPIYSVETVFISEYNRTFSTLHILIESFIYDNPDEKVLSVDYKRLKDRTIPIKKMTKIKFIYLYDEQIMIPSKLTYNNQSFVIPKDFAYAATLDRVNRFEEAMKFNPKVMVWVPPAYELIGVTTAYSVTRNYFSILFRKYSYYIVEAGFSQIWDLKEQEIYRKLDMEWYKNWTLCGKENIWKKCTPLKNYSETYIGSHPDEDSKPLHIDSLRGVFMLKIIGLLIAMITLFIEIGIHHVPILFSSLQLLNSKPFYKGQDEGKNWNLEQVKLQPTVWNKELNPSPSDDSDMNETNLFNLTMPGAIQCNI